ncbi:hypothetical protein I79_009551 [Cricetulus griseus]|uniref:Uncharacterized protein n=1 Tax=Cricetulus griseus TaxID=10029 RepID=G3HG32_CRIGR|nr:hypothetical protein I79_009551 [Cricetulus griseus]
MWKSEYKPVKLVLLLLLFGFRASNSGCEAFVASTTTRLSHVTSTIPITLIAPKE